MVSFYAMMKEVINYFRQMYGYYNSMMGGWGLMGSFGLLTWVALITFLILGIAYFWKEINKPKGRR